MRHFLFILFFISMVKASAQPPDVPNVDSLKTEEEFAYYEDKLLLCIEWLRMNPIMQDYELRIRTGAFIRYWTANTPTLILKINHKITSPILKEKDFPYTADIYMAYYSGMLEYHLTNPEDTNQYTIQSKGIENILQLYYYNKEILEKSEAVQEFLQLSESNELEEWIRRKI